jgi:hypothetical protein
MTLLHLCRAFLNSSPARSSHSPKHQSDRTEYRSEDEQGRIGHISIHVETPHHLNARQRERLKGARPYTLRLERSVALTGLKLPISSVRRRLRRSSALRI